MEGQLGLIPLIAALRLLKRDKAGRGVAKARKELLCRGALTE